MFKLRNPRHALFQMIADFTARSKGPKNELAAQMAQMTSALHYRAAAGKTTTLRQAHKIAEISQPEALNIIARLESAGVVTLEDNIGDTFESIIHLNEGVNHHIEPGIQSKVA